MAHRIDTWSLSARVEGLDDVEVKAAFASGVASMTIGGDGSLWVRGRLKNGIMVSESHQQSLIPSNATTAKPKELLYKAENQDARVRPFGPPPKLQNHYRALWALRKDFK